MAAIIEAGKSVRGIADEAGLNRETLRGRLNGVTVFNVEELGSLAQALATKPAEFTAGWEPT